MPFFGSSITQFKDPLLAGVVDPARGIRSALVSEKPEKTPPPAPGGGGGMPGMGGMGGF